MTFIHKSSLRVMQQINTKFLLKEVIRKVHRLIDDNQDNSSRLRDFLIRFMGKYLLILLPEKIDESKMHDFKVVGNDLKSSA